MTATMRSRIYLFGYQFNVFNSLLVMHTCDLSCLGNETKHLQIIGKSLLHPTPTPRIGDGTHHPQPIKRLVSPLDFSKPSNYPLKQGIGR
jgi:hypothetical protein